MDIPALIQQLRHPDPTQRAAARAALRQVGEAAAPTLVAQLADPFLRDEMMLLLLHINAAQPLVAALPAAPRHVRRHIRTILSQLGAAAVSPLADLLADTAPTHRAAAIEALALIDDPAAHELLLKTAAEADNSAAVLAILALVDAGFNPEVMRRLLRLIQHPDEWVATRAFTALVQVEDEGVVLLVVYVIKDERPFVRSMGVRAVPQLVERGYLSREDGRETLRLMKRDESVVVQWAAIQALATLDSGHP